MTQRALITGITGQDGSYLAELLLEQGYEVHGIIRRASTFNTDRIDHIYVDAHNPEARLFLHYGDLTDGTTLRKIVEQVEPTEVYNLGAQSHVRVSFDSPEYTVDAVGMGTLRLLEAVRDYQQRIQQQVKFYQAGSSEMFGLVQAVPQTETTPFYPRSPYACAKVYGFWQTVNYREAYDLFACNGILFNHECVTADTPVILRRQGLIDILPIEDVVPHQTEATHGSRYTTDLAPEDQFEVWDAQGWVKVTCMTATWNGSQTQGIKPVHRIVSRGAVYQATADHVVFVEDQEQPQERPAGEVQVADTLALIDLPQPTEQMDLTESEAWLLGILVAEGYVSPEGQAQVTHQDPELLQRVENTWRKVTGGSCARTVIPSGFEGGSPVTQLRLNGHRDYGRYTYSALYTRSGYKRIPLRILNAGQRERLAFLEGFNARDGLKFQGFKTSSPCLAAGLYWLVLRTLNQQVVICTEAREDRLCYQLNLNSPDRDSRDQPLRRPLAEVVKTAVIPYPGWLFDLATTSGTFHAGVGQGWIHNSPRRGETFVTRKITRALARIVAQHQARLYLGNMEAKRDWGYAKDYVEGMWMMLQHSQPDDFVLATGETHTVREFVEKAFALVGMPIEWRGSGDQEQGLHAKTGDLLIEIDPRYYRPTEVDLLLGDPAKAKRVLGWQPRVSFDQLVELMVAADLQALGLDPARYMGDRFDANGISGSDRAFIRAQVGAGHD